MPVRRQTMIYTMHEMFQTGQTLALFLYIHMEEEENEPPCNTQKWFIAIQRRVHWRKFMGFFKTHPSR